tara:strand:- start:399 stop:536 length:138 start_codon:yes stop_codon:yes gene_type:complete
LEKKKKLNTHQKRKKMIDDLNGEYNGWWYYAYFKEVLGGNEYRGK